MSKFTLAIALMVAVLVAVPAALFADDVVVKTITPEKPKTSPAPAPSAAPAPAPAADSPIKFDSGNRGSERMFSGLNLTAEQVKQIQPLVEPFAAELKTNNDALQKKMETLRSSNASRDDWTKAFEEARAANNKVRENMVAKVSPLLTEDQAKKFKEQVANSTRRGGGPGGPGGGFNPADMIGGVAERAGITLTDDQKKKLSDKLTGMVQDGQADFAKMRELGQKARDGDAAAQKELDGMRSKMRETFDANMKKMNDAIGEVLTPEQKTKYDEAVGKMRADGDRRMLEGVQRRAERAGVTDEQKAKIADLVKAATEAVGKLKADDRDGRDQLRTQLEKDVKALLSDEAKKKFEEDRGGFGGFGGGRGGNRGGRGGAGGGGNNNAGGNRGGGNTGGGSGGNPGGTTPLPPL